MYDTIIGYYELPERLNDVSMFTECEMLANKRGQLTRYRLSLPGRPQLWYHEYDNGARCSLRVEFSCQRFGVGRAGNVTVLGAAAAVQWVDDWLLDTLKTALPPLGQWRCQQIDYAWNWCVDNPQTYLRALGSAGIGNTQRTVHRDGVVWKQRGKRGASRWTKFYDSGGKLRFEVSNGKRVLAYACRHWFGCERTIDTLLHPGRALYMLSVQWAKLGLHRQTGYASEYPLLHRLRVAYGAAAAGAYYAYSIITSVGVDGVRDGLISSSSYYEWRKRLIDDGFMSGFMSGLGAGVVVLSLPVENVLKTLLETDNLNSSNSLPRTHSLKILPEKFGLLSNLQLPDWWGVDHGAV